MRRFLTSILVGLFGSAVLLDAVECCFDDLMFDPIKEIKE
ncbi:hypothetical protein BH11VER1_BH11VER1_10380 [soil metagenome]